MSITDPAHYTDLAPEPIEVIGGSTYTFGNTWKYICRAGHKPGAAWENDISKARWYVARIISDRMNAGHNVREARLYAAQGLLRLWGRFLEGGPTPGPAAVPAASELGARTSDRSPRSRPPQAGPQASARPTP